MRNRKNPYTKLIALAVCAVMVTLAVVYVFHNDRVQSVKQQQIATGRQKLGDAEARDVTESQAQIDATLERLAPTAQPTVEPSVAPSSVPPQGQTLDKEEMRKRFKNAVVVGDSITEGLTEYGYLTKANAVHDRGVSIAEANKVLDTAIGLQPSALFLSFGMNDLEYFNDDAQKFTTEYKKQIAKLQAALPGVKIYINGILPIQQKAIDKKAAYGYVNTYNEALRAMCGELNLTFIDNTSLVSESFYAADGIHMSRNYYPLWMQHMIEVAGL